ncbi:MAG TPA: hypothetical protein VGQ18_03680 [Gemmatimonadales bacterium]|jgi:hypothetical protein|nr:hypothetical protein [Gemmatimonadales bacterium]
MRRVSLLAVVLAVAACQTQSRRLLLLDLAMSDPVVLDATAAPWHEVGYTVEYRRFYPHVTRADLARYRTVVVLGGREPEAPSDALTLGDIALLTEWTQQGGVVVFGYAGDGEGFLDRWIMNRWLAALGTGLVIGDFPLEDSVAGAGAEPQPTIFPLPQSALHSAGFEPFAAGRNHVVLVQRESQALARSSATAFVRPPREGPGARPRAAVVAAARVREGLVLVLSRHALASLGTDLRPSTFAPIIGSADVTRRRDFLDALARWTLRPAEWASVAPASGHGPLVLTNAPHAVRSRPPRLAPPESAAVITLPQPPPARDSAARAGVPAWINRQGMRVAWTRALGTQRGLDSLLTFVDVSALNVLATEVSSPGRTDSLGLRNFWRPTAVRLEATSLRWFPAITLADLRMDGEPATREIDVHGDTSGTWCGLDSLFWRSALRPAYRALARLGGDKTADLVAGVALDLDVPQDGYAAAGFCDADYREGIRALGLDSAETSRLDSVTATGGARYEALLESGLLGRYESALEGRVAERAQALRAEVRRLNPELRFAFRSARVPSDWFSLGLLRGLSAPDSPVLLWTREPRVRDVLAQYRARGIYALSAMGLTPERAAPTDWPRLRRVAFVEHDGFWLSGVRADSLGRLIRRLSR